MTIAAQLVEGNCQWTKKFPRAVLASVPTPVESLPRLSNRWPDAELFIKRDDYTGLGMGGNKVRQLEYYFGKAIESEADSILITGAVQSNFVRATAAGASRLGLDAHIQLEERVPGVDELYRSSGNVLLSRLFGAKFYSYPEGEDEAGADNRLRELAAELEQRGKHAFVIPLGANHDPLGALAYVDAAMEILSQLEAAPFKIDQIVVTSGSGQTHAGLLTGLRLAGSNIRVIGVCPRRPADQQVVRIGSLVERLEQFLGVDAVVDRNDLYLNDSTLAPGYGRSNEKSQQALIDAARDEGLLLDPVYTAKAMAGMFNLLDAGQLQGSTLFWHTGGQPALFADSSLMNQSPGE